MMNTLKKIVAVYVRLYLVYCAIVSVVAVVCAVSPSAKKRVSNLLAKYTVFCLKCYNNLTGILKFGFGKYRRAEKEAQEKFNSNLADIIRNHEEEYGTVKLDDIIEE